MMSHSLHQNCVDWISPWSGRLPCSVMFKHVV
jgi:hypothetical protein